MNVKKHNSLMIKASICRFMKEINSSLLTKRKARNLITLIYYMKYDIKDAEHFQIIMRRIKTLLLKQTILQPNHEYYKILYSIFMDKTNHIIDDALKKYNNIATYNKFTAVLYTNCRYFKGENIKHQEYGDLLQIEETSLLFFNYL